VEPYDLEADEVAGCDALWQDMSDACEADDPACEDLAATWDFCCSPAPSVDLQGED
jgi:hypothetical protein